MKLTRRQFLRALALLPCLALPNLAQAQKPVEIYLPLVSGGKMVDSCTSILDNANRPNEGPPPSANWLSPIVPAIGEAGFEVLTQQFALDQDAVEQSGNAIWVTPTAANCEAFVTMSVLPSLTNVEPLIEIAARVQVLESNGYYVALHGNNPSGWMLELWATGVGTILLQSVSVVPHDGDELRIRCCGNTISGYLNKVKLLEQTDGTYSAGGYIGFRVSNFDVERGCRLDDFGGGSISDTCCTPDWEATALPVTTKCAEDPIFALVCANGDRLDLIAWESGFELDDPGWRPQVAQFKGGGSYANSQIAEGQTLVAGEYDNVVETIPLVARGTSEAKCIQTYRRLQQFIKRASDYWKEPSEYDDVWLEVRPAGLGCRIGYARVVKASCVDFANPFGQPFFSQQPLSVADGLSLVVEREPLWRAVPPGELIGPLYNLLRNPDFEEWNSGVADSQPDCWSDVEVGGVTGTNARDTAGPKWGRAALTVDVTNSTGAGQAKGVTQVAEGIEDGQEYTVVAWVRNAGVSGGVGRLLVTSLLGQYEVYRSATQHGWTLYTYVLTAGVGDVIGVNCEILSTAAGTDGTVYFDSLMLLKGDWEQEAIDGMLPYMTSSHIVNHWDTGAGHLNYVDAWEVPGDADSLIRLELVNNTTPADVTNVIEKIGEARVGQRRVPDVQDFQNYHDPDGVVDATCSDGDRVNSTPTPGWRDIATKIILGGATTKENAGRFRLLARLYDAKASGSPTLQARINYWLGVSAVNVKTLESVNIPQRAAWNMVDVTPNSAVIWDAKFKPNPPGALGYSLQLNRPTGTGDAYLDYILAMPTDGGYLVAEISPGMDKGVALVADNTASQTISAQGIRAGYTLRVRLGTDYITETCGFASFGGDLYAATQDVGAIKGGIWRRRAGIWSKVLTVSGAIMSLEVYNGLLYGLFDPTGAGNVQLYQSADGVSWTSVATIPLQFGYSLKSFGGLLWIGVGSGVQSSMYTWDGSAAALNYVIPLGPGGDNQPHEMEVYASKLYVGMHCTGGEVYSYSATTGWQLATATGEDEISSLRTFNGKLYIGTGLANGDIYVYDGSTLTQVFSGAAINYRISGLEVRDNLLLAMRSATIAFDSSVWQTEDGITWTKTYDEELLPTRIFKTIIFEGDLVFTGRPIGLLFADVWTLVPNENFEYSIANYQMGGGQNGGFTAPNRRLPDDERRHRWVVSFDRSDGSNVISDKAMIGLGFVPRYLGLLGEG